MMRNILPLAAAAFICTAITATSVFAQSIEVLGLDGRTVSLSLAALERRTVVTEDRGLRTEFQGERPARWIRQVNKIEVRQLQ